MGWRTSRNDKRYCGRRGLSRIGRESGIFRAISENALVKRHEGRQHRECGGDEAMTLANVPSLASGANPTDAEARIIGECERTMMTGAGVRTFPLLKEDSYVEIVFYSRPGP
jgi:hypothetical protein